jgi:hypothetical protein
MRQQLIQQFGAVAKATCRLVEIEQHERKTNIGKPVVIFDD